MMHTSEIDQILKLLRNRFYGKYRGEVVNNVDGSNLGRLEVKVPAVLGDQTVWAMPCVPYAGDKVGFYSLPEAGTGVWVEFEGGKPEYAIWSGCFWKSGQLPSPAPTTRVWKTPKLTLQVDDNAGETLFQTGDFMKIQMTAGGEIVTSVQDQVKHTVAATGVTSDSGGAGKVEVQPAGTVVNNGALEVA